MHHFHTSVRKGHLHRLPRREVQHKAEPVAGLAVRARVQPDVRLTAARRLNASMLHNVLRFEFNAGLRFTFVQRSDALVQLILKLQHVQLAVARVFSRQHLAQRGRQFSLTRR